MRASTRTDSNHPRRASLRTSASSLRASRGRPPRKEICASTALEEIWRSPVNEISLISEIVGETLTGEISACAGDGLSCGLADVEPTRHKMPNDTEMSQRTRIAPCTRRMSERMTSGSTGLSALKKQKVCSSRKKAGSPREMRSEPVCSCDLLSGLSHSESCGLIVISFGVARFRLQDFPGVVVAVLLGVEEPPAVAKRRGNLRSKQTEHCWIAVGLVPAGDLVVAVVLETGHPTKLGIQSR